MPHRSIQILCCATFVGAALAGCSSTEHTEQTNFAFTGQTLRITNENENMPVVVQKGVAGAVGVSVSTTTPGKGANTPAWRLDGTTLDLGTPCGRGWIGLCEGSYTVTVPSGTRVSVNGASVG